MGVVLNEKPTVKNKHGVFWNAGKAITVIGVDVIERTPRLAVWLIFTEEPHPHSVGWLTGGGLCGVRLCPADSDVTLDDATEMWFDVPEGWSPFAGPADKHFVAVGAFVSEWAHWLPQSQKEATPHAGAAPPFQKEKSS